MASEAKSPASSAADAVANPLRLLVVDDAIEHAEMVVEFLRSGDGWPDADMKIATSYDEALDAFAAQPFDVAFFDYWLGARDGLSLLRDIRRRGVETPVIVLTSRGAEEVAVEAMKAGAADYLSKANLSVEALERAIRHALALHAEERQRWHAEAALRASEERFRALVENSSDALLLIDAEGRDHLRHAVVRAASRVAVEADDRPLDLRLHPSRRSRDGRRAHGGDAQQPARARSARRCASSTRTATGGSWKASASTASTIRRSARSSSTRGTSPSAGSSRSSCVRRRRWRRSASWPAASRTTSTTC